MIYKMNFITTLYLFIVGLAFGSFVLAMVDRMISKRDWVKGRSECESCKKQLKPVDLVPLISWLSTKGKCRYCGVKLSFGYPLTELFVGVIFAASFYFWPFELTSFARVLQFVIWLACLVLMSALLVYDLRKFLLPNKFMHPLIGLSAAYALIDILIDYEASALLDKGLAILVGFGVFLLFWVVSKGKWIGDGDVRFGLVIGLMSSTWVQAWLVLFVASLLGLIYALFTVAANSKKSKVSKMKSKIPFGPMLIVALIIVTLFGQSLIDWYSAEILLL